VHCNWEADVFCELQPCILQPPSAAHSRACAPWVRSGAAAIATAPLVARPDPYAT
jgi:hypothetical protein